MSVSGGGSLSYDTSLVLSQNRLMQTQAVVDNVAGSLEFFDFLVYYPRLSAVLIW